MDNDDMSLAKKIAYYENGELEFIGVLQLFSELIKSGLAWHLQGSYGRYAKQLVELGYLSATGDILKREE